MRVQVAAGCCGLMVASAYAPQGLFKTRMVRGRPLQMVEINPNTDENEVLLGELIFGSSDPRMEVAQNPGAYGDDFCNFVNKKADESEDIEERVALKSLIEMVNNVQSALEKAAAEIEAEDAARDLELAEQASATAEAKPILNDVADILAAAKSVSGVADASVVDTTGRVLEEKTEAGLSGSALETYSNLLEGLVATVDQGKLEPSVELAFEQCDFSMLTLASHRQETAAEAAVAAKYEAVVQAINALAAKRLETAATRLGDILRTGTPAKMMDKVAEMGAKGQIDVQLLELIEANRQQAAAAGAAGAQAAELMERLANKCRDSLDRKFTDEAPEKKLLRALLRSDSKESRQSMLMRAFEVKESLALGFGDEDKTEGGVEVEPPKFIAACQQLIADFGNLDDNGRPFSERILELADEAEAIAIEIYGEINTPQDQQDKMWNEATTSVFELEAAEFHAESQGDQMPWQNDKYDDMLPPGFDQETGIKRMGGG